MLALAKPIHTRAVKEALILADMLAKTPAAAIGEVVGETGTGKSYAGYAVMRSQEHAVRICAGEGIGLIELKRRVAAAFLPEDSAANLTHTRIADAVKSYAEQVINAHEQRPLLIVDEANKLGWRHLEYLRFLSDECGLAVLLIGTELYTRQFLTGRTRSLLLQLGRRIGAKRVNFQALSLEEIAAHLIAPRFGTAVASSKQLVSTFYKAARGGNFGDANELANTCERIMRASDIAQLDASILQQAADWLANHRLAA